MAGGRQGAPGFDPRRMRAGREAAHLSQAALAQAVNVHVSTVVEWEAGRQVPRIDTVADIAKALHMRPRDLLKPLEGTSQTLQQMRAAAGKSQQQVANDAGMLRSTYSAIERGETATLVIGDDVALARGLDATDEEVRAAHTASRAAYLERHPRANGHGRRSRRDT